MTLKKMFISFHFQPLMLTVFNMLKQAFKNKIDNRGNFKKRNLNISISCSKSQFRFIAVIDNN